MNFEQLLFATMREFEFICESNRDAAELIQFCHDIGPRNGAPCLLAIYGGQS